MTSGVRDRGRHLLIGGALFVAYTTAALLGIGIEPAMGVITPVWAPTGIALAAFILYGRRMWPAVALGAFAANAASDASILESVFISVGNTLEAVVGATLMLSVGFQPALDRVRDVFALIGLGAVVAPVIAATNGVTVLLVSGDVDLSDYGSAWLLWWVGDALGALVVAPMILVLAHRPWRALTPRRTAEAALLLGLLVAVCSIVFLAGLWRYPLVVFPLLIWAVLRFHQLGAVTASFVVTAFAVGGAVNGSTPLLDGSTREIVQILEGLTASMAVSLLILGAVLAERETAVHGLRSAHAGLAEAQSLAHIGSWEWDLGSNEPIWSDELYRLWGLEPGRGELSYERYLSSIHPDDRELMERAVERAFTGGAPFEFDHRVSLPGGGMRWIHSRGRVVTDADGAPRRLLGTAQDITERKQIDELRDSILSTVSHELRTPLTAIVGFAVTLRERGATLSEEVRTEIESHLAQQAERLESLFADLLDIDRLRRGSVQPHFRETDVARLVQQVVAGHSRGDHEIEIEAEPAPAEVDAPKVERIVDNLLTNAVTHTPKGSEVLVRVAPVGDGVQISVDDNGPGVPPSERQVIFESFRRGVEAAAVAGTGIGLALVAQFAAVHGGRAWVEENAAGGASFRVFLPARHDA